jgi:hypothetical protein
LAALPSLAPLLGVDDEEREGDADPEPASEPADPGD